MTSMTTFTQYYFRIRLFILAYAMLSQGLIPAYDSSINTAISLEECNELITYTTMNNRVRLEYNKDVTKKRYVVHTCISCYGGSFSYVQYFHLERNFLSKEYFGIEKVEIRKCCVRENYVQRKLCRENVIFF